MIPTQRHWQGTRSSSAYRDWAEEQDHSHCPEKRMVFVGTKTEIEGKIRDEGVKERVIDKKVEDAR
jgi:hypothetical protein